MMKLFGHWIAMPVLAAERLPNDKFSTTGEILGTCFAIGHSWMITAGHVIRAIQSRSNNATVGFVSRGRSKLKAADISDIEYLEKDIGILQVEFIYQESMDWFHLIPWKTDTCNILDEVRSFGFPHGFSVVDGQPLLHQRAFQDHIVGVPKFFQPPRSYDEPFTVYELGFSAPVGLSGAPLLTTEGTPLILGVVIGNSRARTLVMEDEEILEKDSTKTVVQQYESVSMAIAVRSVEILEMYSDKLQCTIGDHLMNTELISD